MTPRRLIEILALVAAVGCGGGGPAFDESVTTDPIPSRSPEPSVAITVPPVSDGPVEWTATTRTTVAQAWTIVLSADVLYATDSSELAPTAESVLNHALDAIAIRPEGRIRVTGHTDDQGDLFYNDGLSLRRAHSVATWLTAHGVDSSRVATDGWGESQPVADNGTADGRQRNRRVEITISSPGGKW